MSIGFLFGLPRPVGTEGLVFDENGKLKNAPSSGGSIRFETNTNLTQISDWVTKIIVGMGLVNARQVLSLFKEGITQLAKGLGLPLEYSVPMAAGIAVFFGSCGF